MEKKTLIKKFQFSKVRGQNVNGNTVLSFRFLGLFFVKMIRGLPIKYQEIRSQELKS